jgi:uncharacterized protein (TIGR03000 family)
MLKRRFLVGGVAALALVLASAGPSSAQFFIFPIGPRGAMSPFSGVWGYNPPGVAGVNYAPRGYGYSTAPTYSYPMMPATTSTYSSTYGFAPLGPSYYGNLAVNPYTYAPNLLPYSAPSSVAVAPASYIAYYPPRYNRSAPVVAPAAYTTDVERPAVITVSAPTNAEIWFDGQKTNQTGPERVFTTPALPKGQGYHYDVRARWMEDGKPVTQDQRVDVYAGARVNVTFPTQSSTPNPGK